MISTAAFDRWIALIVVLLVGFTFWQAIPNVALTILEMKDWSEPDIIKVLQSLVLTLFFIAGLVSVLIGLQAKVQAERSFSLTTARIALVIMFFLPAAFFAYSFRSNEVSQLVVGSLTLAAFILLYVLHKRYEHRYRKVMERKANKWVAIRASKETVR